MVRKVLLASCVAAAGFGGWMVLAPASGPDFDFDAASPAERQAWLGAQAKPLARLVDRSLPKDDANRPAMKVSAARVNAGKRVIEIDVAIEGPVAFRTDPIAAKRAFGRQFCPTYAESELGRNEITIIHTFRDPQRKPVMVVGVSPVACRNHMRG